MNFNKYRLKEKYRKILDNLSDEDKIRTTFKKTKDIYLINDILTYYELKDHPLHKELALEKFRTPVNVYSYAFIVIQGRWPEAEEIIKSDLDYVACSYAYEIIQGRWPEAEEFIKENAEHSFYYASILIKGRWPEAEEVIKRNPCWAYHYANEVIKDRWPEAEPYIKTTPEYAFYYAVNVIKGDWPEAEEFFDSYWRRKYKRFLSKNSK